MGAKFFADDGRGALRRAIVAFEADTSAELTDTRCVV